jgi:hypothetical protein
MEIGSRPPPAHGNFKNINKLAKNKAHLQFPNKAIFPLRLQKPTILIHLPLAKKPNRALTRLQAIQERGRLHRLMVKRQHPERPLPLLRRGHLLGHHGPSLPIVRDLQVLKRRHLQRSVLKRQEARPRNNEVQGWRYIQWGLARWPAPVWHCLLQAGG